MLFHVYILRCANNAFYIGYTADLNKRVATHNAGRGSSYTKRNGPVTLVYSESFPSESDAMQRERQLKCWSRAKKQALIDGDMMHLHHLAKRQKH
jgi:predicted GIY-YIG superfamily endonuclease